MLYIHTYRLLGYIKKRSSALVAQREISLAFYRQDPRLKLPAVLLAGLASMQTRLANSPATGIKKFKKGTKQTTTIWMICCGHPQRQIWAWESVWERERRTKPKIIINSPVGITHNLHLAVCRGHVDLLAGWNRRRRSSFNDHHIFIQCNWLGNGQAKLD